MLQFIKYKMFFLFIFVFIVQILTKNHYASAINIQGDCKVKKSRLICTDLDLSEVEITELTLMPGNVKDFECFMCTVEEIPKNFSNVFKNVENLYLSQVGLNDIGIDDFEGSHNLTTLTLTFNNIAKLKNNSFKNVANLEKLYLNLNPITTLEENCFANLTKLRRLSLSFSKLTTLPGNVFSDLKQLSQIDLSYTLLTVIQDGLFKNNLGLREIYLKNSQITTIHRDVFMSLPLLRWLDLRHNDIKKIYLDCLEPIGLQYLGGVGDFWNKAIGPLLSFDENLETIVITNSSRRGVLKNPHSDLLDMDVQFLEKAINLKSLIFRNRPFRLTDKTLFNTNFTRLEKLEITGAGLEAIGTGFFDKMPMLKELNLSKNSLKFIDIDAFEPLTNLQRLQLDFNCLMQFDYSKLFTISKTLNEISINHNYFRCSYLVDVFKTMEEHKIIHFDVPIANITCSMNEIISYSDCVYL